MSHIGACFKILRIPADGSKPEIITIRTNKVTAAPQVSLVDAMGHIPNVCEYWGVPMEGPGCVVIVWRFGKENEPSLIPGHWVLLKNVDKTLDLPLNLNEYWSHMEDRQVWGDAFVCKLDDHPITNGRANYLDVKEEVIDSATLKRFLQLMAATKGYSNCP